MYSVEKKKNANMPAATTASRGSPRQAIAFAKEPSRTSGAFVRDSMSTNDTSSTTDTARARLPTPSRPQDRRAGPHSAGSGTRPRPRRSRRARARGARPGTHRRPSRSSANSPATASANGAANVRRRQKAPCAGGRPRLAPPRAPAPRRRPDRGLHRARPAPAVPRRSARRARRSSAQPISRRGSQTR